MEVLPGDSGHLGGVGDVAACFGQYLFDVDLFEAIPGFPQGEVGVAFGGRYGSGSPFLEDVGQVADLKGFFDGKGDGAFDYVFEFSHVAGPVVAHEEVHGLVGEVDFPVGCVFRQEVLDQKGDVVASFS